MSRRHALEDQRIASPSYSAICKVDHAGGARFAPTVVPLASPSAMLGPAPNAAKQAFQKAELVLRGGEGIRMMKLPAASHLDG